MLVDMFILDIFVNILTLFNRYEVAFILPLRVILPFSVNNNLSVSVPDNDEKILNIPS